MPSIPGVPASQAKIFIDEFELTGQSSGASLEAELQTISYDVMGDSSKHQFVTTPNFTIPHSGYYTGASSVGDLGYFEEELQSRFGTTLPVVVTLVLGEVIYTLNETWGSQLNISAPVEGLITVEGKWSSATDVGRGLVVADGAFDSADESTPIDVGTVIKYNAMVIHASGFDDLTAGAEKVTIAIKTSATVGGTYVTWLTHDFKKPGAVIVSGVDNPNRWMKAVVTLTAGVTDPITAFVGVHAK